MHGAPLNVSDSFPLDATSIRSADLVATGAIEINAEMDGIAAFRESTFFQVFRGDCGNAECEIVIFSPFMTQRGVSRWADFWRARLLEGVKIRIVTRPPGDQGGSLEDGLPELIDNIRKMGIAVDLRTRMHEKMAFIDRRFLWHGSLNILSHRDTTESMLRINSPTACEQLGRFVVTKRVDQTARRRFGKR